jgi:malate dehydrogenase (oxaloacetate-decarboxylating)
MANPVPEITVEDLKDTKAYIIGTGSSKYPNQINNLLAFPGIFRGTLDSHAKKITREMMLAASLAIANAVTPTIHQIVPDALDPNVHKLVAQAVYHKAIEQKIQKTHE